VEQIRQAAVKLPRAGDDSCCSTQQTLKPVGNKLRLRRNSFDSAHHVALTCFLAVRSVYLALYYSLLSPSRISELSCIVICRCQHMLAISPACDSTIDALRLLLHLGSTCRRSTSLWMIRRRLSTFALASLQASTLLSFLLSTDQDPSPSSPSSSTNCHLPSTSWRHFRKQCT